MPQILTRLLITAGIIVGALVVASYFYIQYSVKENIEIAQDKYPGTAEESLIAYLEDETVPVNERTHVAIWTLGKIRSEKALPLLEGLSIDDPEGVSCEGNHEKVLCQSEIAKAIESIKKGGLYTYSKMQDQ